MMAELRGSESSRHATVSFRQVHNILHPLSLVGTDERFEAGPCDVATYEEIIERLSFVAYRRVSETLVAAAKGYAAPCHRSLR